MENLPQEQNTELKTVEEKAFEFHLRKAKMLSQSQLIPQSFQNNIPNVMIAMDIAARVGMNELMVMQNLYIVHGKPSWASQYIISAVNASGRFTPLKFKIDGEGDQKNCYAYATEKESGDVLKGPPVSIHMAKQEQWFQKKGSKWQTMPDLMLHYRAATFFGRLYAPEYLNGMKTQDEMQDIATNSRKQTKEINPTEKPVISKPEPPKTETSPFDFG